MQFVVVKINLKFVLEMVNSKYVTNQIQSINVFLLLINIITTKIIMMMKQDG